VQHTSKSQLLRNSSKSGFTAFSTASELRLGCPLNSAWITAAFSSLILADGFCMTDAGAADCGWAGTGILPAIPMTASTAARRSSAEGPLLDRPGLPTLLEAPRRLESKEVDDDAGSLGSDGPEKASNLFLCVVSSLVWLSLDPALPLPQELNAGPRPPTGGPNVITSASTLAAFPIFLSLDASGFSKVDRPGRVGTDDQPSPSSPERKIL
jgi:hypothetical protein